MTFIDSNRRTDWGAMLNKVPEVTFYFWLVKVLATTVGETAADFLATNLNLGTTNTTYIVATVLIAVLVFQFRSRKYVPTIYWPAVVLLSIVGTLITDNLVDNLGISLPVSTTVFAIALTATFVAWFVSERTLSIHSIVTSKREAYYWLAILFTFALGTASGDLVAERINIGYWKSALLFGIAIGLISVAHYQFKLHAIPAFWLAYILTRPLGASMGDYLSQPRTSGGLGLGTVDTTAIFLATILGVVVYLNRQERNTAILNSPNFR